MQIKGYEWDNDRDDIDVYHHRWGISFNTLFIGLEYITWTKSN